MQILQYLKPHVVGLSCILMEPRGYRGDTEFTTLERVARVCRAWNSLTMGLLYAHVVLMTPKQTRLFLRTMDTAPHLIRLVEQLTVGHADVAYPAGGLLRNFRNYNLSFSMPKEVTLILARCHSVCTLSASFNAFAPRCNSHTPQLRAPHSLHRVILNDSISIPFLRRLDCSRIKVLYLHNADSLGHGSDQLPVLPQLHTLQVSQLLVSLAKDVFCNDSLSRVFPALRELVVHNTHSSCYESILVGMDDPYPFCFGTQLETLRVIEVPHPNYHYWESWERLSNIKHVTLGVLSHRDTLFGSWRPPIHVETLCLLVGIDRSGVSSLEQVYNCLVACQGSRRLESLQALTLNMVPLEEVDEPSPMIDWENLRMWANRIQLLCSSWGVDFSYSTIGEC